MNQRQESLITQAAHLLIEPSMTFSFYLKSLVPVSVGAGEQNKIL